MDIHFEKDLVINGRTINYKGIFRHDEIFRTINEALEKRGYIKREKKSEELVTESGRKSFVELRPYKEKTNYVTLMMKIKVEMDHVTETTKEFETGSKKYQQGNLTVIFDAWFLSDYRNRWGMRPFYYFMKAMINRFLYSMPLESGFRGELQEDTANIASQIKKLLKTYQPTPPHFVKDEEVKEKIAEEIRKESGNEG